MGGQWDKHGTLTHKTALSVPAHPPPPLHVVYPQPSTLSVGTP